VPRLTSCRSPFGLSMQLQGRGELIGQARELIDWDAAVIAEDRDMLESTDPDAIVDMSRKIEMHMPSDRPGIITRNRPFELLRAHGEKEQARTDSVEA
jgi:hypothetical protein